MIKQDGARARRAMVDGQNIARHAGVLYGRGSVEGGGVHPTDIPRVTVGVLELPRVHDTVVLSGNRLSGACGQGEHKQLIDPVTTVVHEGIEGFDLIMGIHYRLRREFGETGIFEKHDKDCVADDHACGAFIRKLRVKTETQLRVEVDRSFQAFYRQIDKNHR